jgi:hypothetical protein
MMSVTEISAVVAAAGVLAGVTYYVAQMRNQTRLMRTDALMKLYSLTATDELQEPFWLISTIKAKDYEEYVKEYGSPLRDNSNKPVNLAVMKVLGIFDLVGTLLYKKLIDVDLVHLALNINLTRGLYKRLSPLLEGIRKVTNEPTAFGGFDYLVAELTRNESRLKNDVERMMDRSRVTASS